MNRQQIESEKATIVSQIEKYVPLIKEFFELDATVEEYSERLHDFEVLKVHADRQQLAKKIIQQKIISLFGEDTAKRFKVNFGRKLAFNIADHHQVLNHPLLISANFLSHVRKFFTGKKQDAIVVISSGDVPPNNYFSKGGFQLHDKRVPLFSVSEREFSAYYTEKRDFDLTKRLKTADKWKDFTGEEKEFLQAQQKRIEGLDFSRCKDYKDQISVIVQDSWPQLFEEKARSTIPDLLYITQEEFTTQALLEILKDEQTFIYQTLFGKELRRKVLDCFRGIVVAWRESEGKGTHFFWRKYPGEPRSLRMYIEGDKLVPQDERFKHLAVHLDKATILEMLQKGEIYPSLFMIFSVLNFYLGVKPLTGYGSRVYLEFFKQAWIKALTESPFTSEIDFISSVETSGFVAGLAVFFKRIKQKLKTQYAYDIFYDGGIKRAYLEKISQMKFRDLVSVSVADIYDYYSQKYIPQGERIQPKINFDDLASITFDWV